MCKSGFKREVVNGNESIPCVPCECNGHSFDCHPITGVCMNCSNNTVGNFCEECEDGFFGDASSGGSCQACMCYHPVGSNGIVCDKVELPHVSKALLMCSCRCLVIADVVTDILI